MILNLATFYSLGKLLGAPKIKVSVTICIRKQNEQCEIGCARRHGLLQGEKYELHGSYTSVKMFVLNVHILYGTTENTKQIFC